MHGVISLAEMIRRVYILSFTSLCLIKEEENVKR